MSIHLYVTCDITTYQRGHELCFIVLCNLVHCILYTTIPSSIRQECQDLGHKYSICIIISVCSILGVLYLNTYHHTNLPPYRYVSDSNALLAVLTAICSFMYFKNVHIPQSKFINMIGGSTFGILLIHANSDTMRKWLWVDLRENANHYQDN